MCSGPTDGVDKDGRFGKRTPPPDLGRVPLDPNDPGNQANPFLINQQLGRFFIGTPQGTSVGDLKNPNPFSPPGGLVPLIGKR